MTDPRESSLFKEGKKKKNLAKINTQEWRVPIVTLHSCYGRPFVLIYLAAIAKQASV